MTNQNNPNKISILFLIDFLVSKYGMAGGTERQLIDKISRLDTKKFTPFLIYLQKRFDSELINEINCYQKVLHVYSLSSFNSINKYIWLWKFIKKNKIDIIETISFDSIIIGVITAKLAGIRNVLSCRRDMGFWYSKKLLLCLKLVNFFTKKVITNSKSIKLQVASLEKVRSDKIDVIYNGIDTNKFLYAKLINLHNEFSSIYSSDKIVGIVANFNRHVKRIDLFIKAVPEIVKTEKKVKFIIVGDGKLKPELIKLSHELEVADYLIWTGRKDDPIPYIKCFDIGVVSSDSEGFCNAILEYMAAGVPVVATDTGGNPELVEDGRTGFLVPVNDPHALADKISFLLENKELASAMGQRGREIVEEKYSWDKIIKEYEAYYQKLASQEI